jgi:hypothetical protein
MSLLRLLSAGKSLVGLKQEVARYRMSDPRAMPRFGSARNPFKARKAAAVPSVAAPAAVAPESLSAPQAAASASAPVIPQPVVSVPAASASATARVDGPSKKPMPFAAAAQFGAGWKRWLARCVDKLKLKRRPRQTRPAPQTRPARGPVQGELSLDSIRVVRNDLSDTDFEVVTRKPVATPVAMTVSPGPAAEPPRPAMVEAARGRMAARLFCAGKT